MDQGWPLLVKVGEHFEDLIEHASQLARAEPRLTHVLRQRHPLDQLHDEEIVAGRLVRVAVEVLWNAWVGELGERVHLALEPIESLPALRPLQRQDLDGDAVTAVTIDTTERGSLTALAERLHDLIARCRLRLAHGRVA